MARLNLQSPALRTFEGAPAQRLSDERTLERSVMACLLWEDSFYEGGASIAARIETLALKVSPTFVADLAVRTRHEAHLRHAPLMLLYALTRTGAGVPGLVRDTFARVIARPDELTEFLALYWSRPTATGARRPLSAGAKKGLAAAIRGFDAYQLSKYDRDAKVKLRDVLRLVHAKPRDEAQSGVFGGLVSRSLRDTRTWEARQSRAGQVASCVAREGDLTSEERVEASRRSKAETWTDQLARGEVGYDAVLKNLRGMLDAGVDPAVVADAVLARRGGRRVLPFRFVAAWRAVEAMRGVPAEARATVVAALDGALSAVTAELPRLDGLTAVLVDVSASMDATLSARSDLRRSDAAAALAALFPGDADVFSFSDRSVRVREARGLAGIGRIVGSQPHGGTRLGEAIRDLGSGYDRVVVLTDEQSASPVPLPSCRFGYLVNLAAYEAAVGEAFPDDRAASPARRGTYGDLEPKGIAFGGPGEWVHLTGFSENTFRFLAAFEAARF